MRFKLCNGALLIIALSCGDVAYTQLNLLSFYSDKWDRVGLLDSWYNSENKQLNSIEKDFISVFNLARLNPILFSETVLAPYNQQHTYSESAKKVLIKIAAEQNKGTKLSFSKWLRAQVKEQVETQTLSTYSQDKWLKFEPDSIRGGVIEVTAANATEIFLAMLTATGEPGYLFRKYFESDDDLIGLTISQTDQNRFLVAFMMERLDNTKKFNNHINLTDHPNDEVLVSYDRMIAKKRIIYYNDDFFANSKPKLIRREDIEQLNNHFIQQSITSKHNNYFYTLQSEAQQYQQPTNMVDLNTYNYDQKQIDDFDADSAVNYYSISKRIDPHDSICRVEIVHLTTPPPTAPFPEDSIGKYIDTISFEKVDSFVYTIRKQIDEKKIGIILTKPWKKEMEKVRAIFMWMQHNIQYDYEGLAKKEYTYLVSDIFKKRVAVCEGYANMFQYLCEQAGIRSYKIHGYVYPVQVHAWNSVCIDKKWYLVDVTWGMNYFLTNPTIFLKDHYSNKRRWQLLTKPLNLQEWIAYEHPKYQE